MEVESNQLWRLMMKAQLGLGQTDTGSQKLLKANQDTTDGMDDNELTYNRFSLARNMG